METDICNKRREYLVINQFYNKLNGNDINDENLKQMKRNQRIYCGNWSKLTDKKYVKNGSSNFLPKSVHFVGDVANSTTSIGFRILYVVRSAMPPVINDGKRLEQQNGFKVKVRLVKMR